MSAPVDRNEIAIRDLPRLDEWPALGGRLGEIGGAEPATHRGAWQEWWKRVTTSLQRALAAQRAARASAAGERLTGE